MDYYEILNNAQNRTHAPEFAVVVIIFKLGRLYIPFLGEFDALD